MRVLGARGGVISPGGVELALRAGRVWWVVKEGFLEEGGVRTGRALLGRGNCISKADAAKLESWC